MKEQASLWSDSHYVHGHIAGLRALILALAQSVPKEHFLQQGLARIESARTAFLSKPVGENSLLALDHIEEWLKNVTG